MGELPGGGCSVAATVGDVECPPGWEAGRSPVAVVARTEVATRPLGLWRERRMGQGSSQRGPEGEGGRETWEPVQRLPETRQWGGG